MNLMTGPKAIHIIRPSDHPTGSGGIAFKHEPIKKKKPNINLFDPSKQPPPLKRPVYNAMPTLLEKKDRVILSEKTLHLHNKQLNMSSVLSQSDTSSDDSSHESDDDARTNRKVVFG